MITQSIRRITVVLRQVLLFQDSLQLSLSFGLSALPFVRLTATEPFRNALLDSELGKSCCTYKVID